jgi:hypothetical protein
MPVVKIEPSAEHPIPYSTGEEKPATFMDEITITALTAELLEELGAPVEVDAETLDAEKRLIDDVIENKNTKNLKNLPTALGASAFLKAYGQSRAFDIDQVRAALTNKLLEIADCGDTKYELKALELLGKHSDIGLFTQRSEITVNYNSPEALENAIKERVKRLLNADIIDITPLGKDLDEELGVAQLEYGEFSEVEDPEDYDALTEDERHDEERDNED